MMIELNTPTFARYYSSISPTESAAVRWPACTNEKYELKIVLIGSVAS